jgi:hypothetical protein
VRPLCASRPSICFLSILPLRERGGDFVREKRKEREGGKEGGREGEKEIERETQRV